MFAIVPKSAATLSGNASPPLISYVIHVLQPTNEIGPVYHNAEIQPTTSIRAEFPLARFAWAIFPFLTTFLTLGYERSLILVDGTTTITKQATADEYYAFADAESSQSRSSKSHSIPKSPSLASATTDNDAYPELYPGYRELDRLRQTALQEQRPPGWVFNPDKYERGSIGWMKEMGYEVQDYDDFDKGGEC
jgi:hypothetical protein